MHTGFRNRNVVVPVTISIYLRPLLHRGVALYSTLNSGLHTQTTRVHCTTLYPGFHIQTTPVQSLYFVLNLHLHTQTTPAVEGITGASQKYYNSCPQNSRKSAQTHKNTDTHRLCIVLCVENLCVPLALLIKECE